jgi:uncharacterized protein (TIGR02246 family)
MTSDQDQIRQLVRHWLDATRRGDTQAVLELMTDDVVFLVPGRPPFGKQAFAEASRAQAQPDGMSFDGRSTIEEIVVSGDWAFMRTRLSVTTTQAGQAVNTRSGHTLTVLRREDGNWKLARDANLLGTSE